MTLKLAKAGGTGKSYGPAAQNYLACKINLCSDRSSLRISFQVRAAVKEAFAPKLFSAVALAFNPIRREPQLFQILQRRFEKARRRLDAFFFGGLFLKNRNARAAGKNILVRSVLDHAHQNFFRHAAIKNILIEHRRIGFTR